MKLQDVWEKYVKGKCWKEKLIVLKRKEYDVIDFGVEGIVQGDLNYLNCKVIVKGEWKKNEKVRAFKYVGMIFCKNRSIMSEIREKERIIHSKRTSGDLESTSNSSNVSK